VRQTGDFYTTSIGGEQVRSFIPRALPPDPPLQMSIELSGLIERAGVAMGRLDMVATLLPADLLLYFYIRKEAILSSQIEGTQSSFSDLLLFESQEMPGVPVPRRQRPTWSPFDHLPALP
jgi:Fic family protein